MIRAKRITDLKEHMMEQKINISVIPKFVDNVLDKPSKTMGQNLANTCIL